MTNIIELARQAGFVPSEANKGSIYLLTRNSATDCAKELQAFAALVRNAALEEAALKCDAIRSTVDSRNDAYEDGMIGGLHDCAKAIRALKEQP